MSKVYSIQTPPVRSWGNYFFNQSTIINFKFKQYNTSTQKSILKLLEKLDEIYSTKNIPLKVNWYYADDDDKEEAEELEEITNVKFDYIKV
jgi:hypothetical protein